MIEMHHYPNVDVQRPMKGQPSSPLLISTADPVQGWTWFYHVRIPPFAIAACLKRA